MTKTGKHDTFGARLGRILMERRMTQSDLAREVFGNEKGVDKRGYEFPLGKDRISSYVNDRQRPSPANYEKILEVLKLTPDDLPMPEKAVSPRTVYTPSAAVPMELKVMAGTNGLLSMLRINSVVTVEAAIKIMDIVEKDRAKREELAKRRAAGETDEADPITMPMMIEPDEI